MLESDEVDDDFFTPVAGTSLANIFGNVSKDIVEPSNDSLKYVPPRPQNIPPKPKQEQIKTTECIFACAMFGHEWSNNVYTTRGKVGFALVKIQKTGDHNIVLYDANKSTLSCTTISTHLEVIVRNNTYISYYDNLQKYWSLCGVEREIQKIADHLRSFGAKIKYSSYKEPCPPEHINLEFQTNITYEQFKITDKESDTDCSMNRRTKASILNRMANMGHSVLPTRALPTERTSDSSDTMDTETQPKSVRHKPVKTIIKKNNVENIIPQSQHLSEHSQGIIMHKTESVENVPMYSSHNSQLLPLTSPSILTSTGNEFGMFISEQRISNSELRINMNRITDRVDLVLDKINNFEQKGNTNIQTDILMKLLSEYENKIKVYEELLRPRGDKVCNETAKLSNNVSEIEILQNKISELEKQNLAKCNEVINLQEKIGLLKTKSDEEKLAQAKDKDELLNNIDRLDNTLKAKDDEIANLAQKCSLSGVKPYASDDNIGDKVKNIMNNTFQTISINFDDSENYTGDSVKKIVAKVIKKITINTLSEL